MNECTRRLNLLSKKLGSHVEKSRTYYELLKTTKQAQQECQQAAVLYQKANGIYAAAKETVALAEQRFLTNQHEWQFDNAWQEMLNHATMKVMEAENERAEKGREHHRLAVIFKQLEQQLKQQEEKYLKSIIKSRPYFDEKLLCEEQLNTQKERIESIRKEIVKTKQFYSQTLNNLEQISNEIHMKRNDGATKLVKSEENDLLKRPREPGVGAELKQPFVEKYSSLPDINAELDKCEVYSVGSASLTTSERDDDENMYEELEDIKSRFNNLNVRPVDGGGEGKPSEEVFVSECEICLK